MPSTFEEQISHPCFPQPEQTYRPVWRYLPLQKLIALFDAGALYLSRLDSLNDPHEGAFPRQMIELRDDLYKQTNEIKYLPQHIRSNRNSRTCCYVNCWTLSDFESEALWRLYTGPSEGVAIRSTYSKLVDVVRNDDQLFVGCVTYLDYDAQRFDNPWWPAGGNNFQPVMHKRLAFAHEHEVRLAKWVHHYHLPEADRPAGMSVPIDIDALIEGIFINPYAPEWYAKVVNTVVARFAPQLVSRVHWSRMKCEPLY